MGPLLTLEPSTDSILRAGTRRRISRRLNTRDFSLKPGS